MSDGFLNESDFHHAFERWLKDEGLLFITSRMDKATTQQNGEPDYLIVKDGRVLAVELKMKKGKLSTAQVFRHADYARAGTTVHVVRDIGVAQTLVTEWRAMLGVVVPKPAPDAGLRRWGNAVFKLGRDGHMKMLRPATDADLHLPLVGSR